MATCGMLVLILFNILMRSAGKGRSLGENPLRKIRFDIDSRFSLPLSKKTRARSVVAESSGMYTTYSLRPQLQEPWSGGIPLMVIDLVNGRQLEECNYEASFVERQLKWL